MNTLDKVYDLTIDIKNIDVKYNSYAKFFDDDRETSVIRIKLLNDKTPMNLENCIVEASFILADNTYHNETCKIINSSEGVVELQLCQKCLVKGENIVRLSILKDNEISNTPVITYEVRKGLYSDNPSFNDDPLTPILSQMLLDIKVTKVNQIELQERYEKSLPKIEGKIKEVDNAIDRVNNAIASGTQDLEVKEARADKNGIVYAKLGDRLNEVDSQLEHNVKLISDIGTSYNNFVNFSEMEDYIISQIKNNGGTNHDQGMVVIDIPAGKFEITDFDILSKYTRRVGGLCLRGRGSKITQIYFNPEQNDKYLFKNNDIWLNLRFEGIEFVGNIEKNTSFMFSESHGGAQNYIFTDCRFSNFDKVLDLKGTNCNSEISFYSCNFNGVIKDCLYVGQDVDSDGDQFLNYNFFACNYEVDEGNFVNMARGGNINVYGGSFIHIPFDSDIAKGGTFFKFPTSYHAYGVCRLLVNGVRFECRNRNSKLIECEWNMGNIEFLNCDLECYELDSNSKNWINAIFNASALSMPSIVFDNCSLLGKHQYKLGTEGYLNIKNIIYQNCKLSQEPGDFITYTNINNSNKGAMPHIKFRNTVNYPDYEVNGLSAGRAIMNKKYISVKNWFGSLPYLNGKEDIKMPWNAIITGFYMYLPQGKMTSAAKVNYKLKNNEPNQIILFDSTDEGDKYFYEGFTYKKDMFYVCDTEEKRTLSLIDFSNLDQISDKSICLIEYI